MNAELIARGCDYNQETLGKSYNIVHLMEFNMFLD